MRTPVAVGCSALFFVLVSCRSAPQITALDGLVSSRSGVGSGQTALMNLHSLAVEPGVLVRLPSNNGRATSSALVEHTSADNSYLRVETYEANADATAMKNIRTAIEKITFSIGKQMSDRVEKAKAASLDRKADAELNTVKKQAEVANAKETEKVEAEKTQRINEAVANGAASDAIRALADSLPSKAVDMNAMVKVNSAQATATEAKTRSDTATSSAKATEQTLNDDQEKLSAALSLPNIVVFRWNTGDNDSAALDLFGKSETQAQEKRLTNGYAVLNGIRRVRLVVGEDLVSGKGGSPNSTAAVTLGGLAKAGELASSHRGVIVTSVLQTREIMYFTAEDLEQSLREKLDLKVSDLMGTGLTPEEIANLKIQAELDLLRLRSIQNSGYFSKPRIDMIKIDDWGRIRHEANKILPPARGSTGLDELSGPDWITIHAVVTTVDALLDQRRNAPADPTVN